MVMYVNIFVNFFVFFVVILFFIMYVWYFFLGRLIEFSFCVIVLVEKWCIKKMNYFVLNKMMEIN